MSRDDLIGQARTFAASISDLLNNTICDGVRISAVLDRDGAWCGVGLGVTKHNVLPRAIPVTLGKKKPRCYLMVGYVLGLDPEQTYLAVQRSVFGVYADESFEEMVLHYDYIREPDHAYPRAHLQVAGASTSLAKLCERAEKSTELKDLHLPVGGVRFRPTLEDVVEFLIVEGLVEVRDGAAEAIAEVRDEWYRLQLRAAVRRDPETARDILRILDDTGQS